MTTNRKIIFVVTGLVALAAVAYIVCPKQQTNVRENITGAPSAWTPGPLTPDQLKPFENAASYTRVNEVAKLPTEIFALCFNRGAIAKMADPGGKWNVTDAIFDSTLPNHRLIWAATDGVHYVVHYEEGGMGHSFHIVLAALEKAGTKPTLDWHATVAGELTDYESFLQALKAGKLDNSEDYGR